MVKNDSNRFEHEAVLWRTYSIRFSHHFVNLIYSGYVSRIMSPLPVDGEGSLYNLLWKQEGGVQVYLYCLFIFGAGREWVVSATPRLHYPGEWPGTNCTGECFGPLSGLDGCGKSCLHRDWINGPSNAQRVAMWATQYYFPVLSCSPFVNRTLVVTVTFNRLNPSGYFTYHQI